MTAELAEASIATRHVLGAGQRLSHSLLWELQRAFYSNHGVDAWRKGHVPYRITNSPFIADQYAQIVAAYLEDRRASLADPTRPIDIIELGAGCGQFSFHFLRRLGELTDRMPTPIRWRLVMTDLAERNLEFWRAHQQLAPYVRRGVLDFARFAAGRDHDITLLCSGETLTPPLTNGAVFLANYFFDTLPIDVFAVESGQLRECRVTLTSSRPEPDLRDPDALQRIDLRWHTVPTTADGYYEDPAFDRVLREYQGLPDTTVQLPIEALRCCRLLRELAGGRMLLLTSDKGYVDPADLALQTRPELMLHGSSFSLCLDFHALGRYFEGAGGALLRPRHSPILLLTVAMLLGDEPDGHPRTRHAFADTIDRFNPDDALAVDEAMVRHLDDATVDELLAVMRSRLADPWLVARCLSHMEKLVEHPSDQLRRDLTRILDEAWDRHYLLDAGDDFPFAAGITFYQMDDYERALTFYQRSLDLFGASPHTHYNIAICHHLQKRPREAELHLRRTLELMPDHTHATALLRELTTPG